MGFTKYNTKAIKGIAIILMLYHHLFFFPDRISDEIVYLPIIKIGGMSLAYFIGEFGNICVSIYLFLGGYGTYISCRKSENVWLCIFNKVKTLYAEYWKIFAVFVPICMIAGVDRVEKKFEILILNFTGMYTSYCGEWWFFTPYVTLLVVFPILYRLINKYNNAIVDFAVIVMFDILIKVLFSIGLSDKLYENLLYATPGAAVLMNVYGLTLATATSFCLGCIFAKYDLLSKLKSFFVKKRANTFLAFAMLVFIFYLRHHTGSAFDFVYVPFFISATIAVLEKIPVDFSSALLMKIGNESTTIWLVHSIYCYLLCQKLVFTPRYTVLIFIWLLVMSYFTSIVLRKIFNLISNCGRLGVKRQC